MAMDVFPTVADWTEDQSLNTETYTTVWESPAVVLPASFYSALFKVNSSQIKVKIVANGHTICDHSLDDLISVYKLGQGHAAAVSDFILVEYQPSLWRFNPRMIIRIEKGDSISFQMKALTDGGQTKKLVNGVSYWGKP